MSRLLIPILLLFAQSSFAETTAYEVSGMTCGSCVKAIKNQVCKVEGVDRCEVSVGKITLSSKPGTQLDAEKVKAAVARAGEYKVINSTPAK